MSVRKFSFIPFDQWYKRQEDYSQEIGDYTCAIEIFSWGSEENVYVAAIAPCSNPINIYAPKKICHTFRHNKSDMNALKDWYEKVIVELNAEWEKFILKNYFLQEKD